MENLEREITNMFLNDIVMMSKGQELVALDTPREIIKECVVSNARRCLDIFLNDENYLKSIFEKYSQGTEVTFDEFVTDMRLVQTELAQGENKELMIGFIESYEQEAEPFTNTENGTVNIKKYVQYLKTDIEHA